MDELTLALLGDPVHHSLSPVMHQRALRDTGLRGRYEVIEAGPARLEQEIDAVRRGARHGINVTMPLKGIAFALCDQLTPEAKASGSVNTIGLRGGAVVGHSTDVVAMTAVLAGWGRSPLLILGAGGSARAALASVRVETYLSARRIEGARELLTADGARMVGWGACVAGAVLINATPLGMGGEPLPPGVVTVAAALLDLPYGPKPTPAVVEAKEVGIPMVDGIEFLALQAAASFSWWTGESVDSTTLAAEARNV